MKTDEQLRLSINASNRRSYERRRKRFPGYDSWRKARWRRANRAKYAAELKRNKVAARLRQKKIIGLILWAIIQKIGIKRKQTSCN